MRPDAQSSIPDLLAYIEKLEQENQSLKERLRGAHLKIREYIADRDSRGPREGFQ